jgi:hypothetical protein
VAEDDPDEQVLLVGGDAHAGSGGRRQVFIGGLAQDGDLLDGFRVRSESVTDPVAQVLSRVIGIDGYGQVTPDGWHGRHRGVGAQVSHLVGHAGIGVAQQADVRDAFSQHEETVQAHAEGQAAPAGQAGPGEHVWMGEAAFPHLDPALARGHVHLATFEGAGVDPGLGPVGESRGEGFNQAGGHLFQIGHGHGPGPGDAPQVELVGGAAVLPVDCVAPVDDAGADQQHVVDGIGGQGPQGRRHHGGGVAAQHPAVVEVAGVAGIAADGIRADQ